MLQFVWKKIIIREEGKLKEGRDGKNGNKY
jgi:hypothetical protein